MPKRCFSSGTLSGHYYKNRKFVYYNDIAAVQQYHTDTHEEIYAKLNRLLTESLINQLESDSPIVFLLSSGLDKFAILLSQNNSHLCGGMDKDAIDLKYARIVADCIGSEHPEIIITNYDEHRAEKS